MPSIASPQRPDRAQHESALNAAVAGDSLELPPLPQVAVEVARLASTDPSGGDARTQGSAAALADLIQRDVALASQVMRVANSALYSRRAPVVSLPQAIAWLGFDTVRNIALAFAVRSELFLNPAFEARMKTLWRESVLAACIGREIARTMRRNVELAYLCGLLHRVGLAVILWRLAQAPASAALAADDAALDLFVAGFESKVGAQLARAWNLPRQAALCISHWREPAAAVEHRADVLVVAIARALGAQLQRPEPVATLAAVPPEWLEETGLYPEDLTALLERREVITATVDSFG